MVVIQVVEGVDELPSPTFVLEELEISIKYCLAHDDMLRRIQSARQLAVRIAKTKPDFRIKY